MIVNKLGSYISKLMTVIVDESLEEFVVNLATQELVKIRNDLNSFLQVNRSDDAEKTKKTKKTKKKLLQEDK